MAQMPPPPPNYPLPLPTGAISGVEGLPNGVVVASPWLRLGAYWLESVLMLVTLFVGWLVWAAMLAGRGQTPAKSILKLRVIGSGDLRPVGFGRMLFMRGVVGGFVASLGITCTLGILAFMPFWDKRNQNIWDKVSSTYVVSDPNDAWLTKPKLT